MAEGLNMVDPLERFRLDYAPLLLRYLSQRDEAALKLAYELGRDAMRASVSLLDVIRVHHELFLDVLATVRDVGEAQSVARSASTLLMDLIASFDLSRRAFTELQSPKRPNLGHDLLTHVTRVRGVTGGGDEPAIPVLAGDPPTATAA